MPIDLRHLPRPQPPRRGTVMIETVLVLPLIVTVLALIFYFGWAMPHLQRAAMVDRYAAWRQVTHAPGPAATADSTAQLNTTFFAGKAASLQLLQQVGFPTAARQAWLAEAAALDPNVGRLARSAAQAWPAGREVSVQLEYNATTPLGRFLQGTIRHHHVRLGNEWKYVNRMHLSPTDEKWHPMPRPVLSLSPYLRQIFFPNLDAALRPLDQRGNAIAHALRQDYAAQPPYAGPALPNSWRPAP